MKLITLEQCVREEKRRWKRKEPPYMMAGTETEVFSTAAVGPLG